jgi:hypothetical protein
MNDRTESTVRAARWALLPAIAAIALFAGMPAAVAADQQASDEAEGYTLSQDAAGVGTSARAQAPAPAARHYRHAR